LAIAAGANPHTSAVGQDDLDRRGSSASRGIDHRYGKKRRHRERFECGRGTIAKRQASPPGIERALLKLAIAAITGNRKAAGAMLVDVTPPELLAL